MIDNPKRCLDLKNMEMICMNFRSLDEIDNEISYVKSLLEPMEEYLSKNPYDLSVKSNTRNLNDRLTRLYHELILIKNKI